MPSFQQPKSPALPGLPLDANGLPVADNSHWQQQPVELGLPIDESGLPIVPPRQLPNGLRLDADGLPIVDSQLPPNSLVQILSQMGVM